MKNHLRLVGGNSSGDESPSEDLPVLTSMFEPCEVFMAREHLIAMLEMNIEAYKYNLEREDPQTPELLEEARRDLRQREELLAWARRVKTEKDDLIFMAIYPTTLTDELEPTGELDL